MGRKKGVCTMLQLNLCYSKRVTEKWRWDWWSCGGKAGTRAEQEYTEAKETYPNRHRKKERPVSVFWCQLVSASGKSHQIMLVRMNLSNNSRKKKKNYIYIYICRSGMFDWYDRNRHWDVWHWNVCPTWCPCYLCICILRTRHSAPYTKKVQ